MFRGGTDPVAIAKTVTKYVEKHNLLHKNQNAFRKHRGTDEHCFALMQAIQTNPNCIAVFVDIKKAYPTVYKTV